MDETAVHRHQRYHAQLGQEITRLNNGIQAVAELISESNKHRDEEWEKWKIRNDRKLRAMEDHLYALDQKVRQLS